MTRIEEFIMKRRLSRFKKSDVAKVIFKLIALRNADLKLLTLAQVELLYEYCDTCTIRKDNKHVEYFKEVVAE